MGESMEKQEWGFKENHELHAAAAFTIRHILQAIIENIDEPQTGKSVIHLGHGDPSAFPLFRTPTVVEDALIASIRSAHFNSGANHAIEIILTVLARPGANILFPRPNYPIYEARARFSPLEVRHYDLIPDKGWEVDLDGVKALANDKTVAIVLINPGNPCGNVFTFEHMKKIAETARQLGILVIADEVYAHQVFGEKPFIPMGVFGDIAPVVTLGSLSKRWVVPADPPTVIQVKLNIPGFDDVVDDTDFCMKLAKEESLIVFPGDAAGLKNWVRVSFAAEPEVLKDAIRRMKAFCLRHAKHY
ncbi:Aminotransferase, class I/classII [Cynara cardunculus var. scolymus]|uniref:Aminotransferase, class I/classII n=1 Tax=Cynara cardunculus var. scolymus TaxID=59895 RepID=A0A118K2F5_CYNCS|nr:Aminotransferase, class I/classII [Cynara cardunculus var. scolymus]